MLARGCDEASESELSLTSAAAAAAAAVVIQRLSLSPLKISGVTGPLTACCWTGTAVAYGFCRVLLLLLLSKLMLVVLLRPVAFTWRELRCEPSSDCPKR